MQRYQKEQRFFYLEVAVDLFYFQKLVRLIESQRRERSELTRGDSSDAGLRSKTSFGLIATESTGTCLRKKSSITLCIAPLRQPRYGASRGIGLTSGGGSRPFGFTISPGLSEVEGLTEIEILAERERFRFAAAATARPMFQLRGVLAYLWLLEAEVRDLAVLVEGKHAGLPGEDIGRRLVRAA